LKLEFDSFILAVGGNKQRQQID